MAHWIERVLTERKKLREEQPWPVALPVERAFRPSKLAVPRVVGYPRPANDSKRFFHWSASCYPIHANYQFHLDRMVQMHGGGVKYLSDGNGNLTSGDSGLQFGIDVLARGMIPVVRYYMDAGHKWTDANSYATEKNVRAGIVYIETLNEPDLNYEWNNGQLPKEWLKVAFENWIDHAKHILELGGIPLSPALASGVFNYRNPDVGQVTFNPFTMVYAAGIRKFVCSIHNYALNHPMAYPADAVNQVGQPLTQAEYDRVGGPPAWDGETIPFINAVRQRDKNPGATLMQDDSCFRACEIFRDLLIEANLADIPIITTEGGPCLTDRQDGRYPRVTPVVMQDLILGELEYMSKDPLYIGHSWWLYGNGSVGGTYGWSTNQWYWPSGPFSDSNGMIPAYELLEDRPLSDDGNAGIEVPEEPPDEGEEPPVSIPVNDAESYGVTVQTYVPKPDELYAKVIKVHHLTPEENNGMHNVFMDLLDQDGKRMYGKHVKGWWGPSAGESATAVIDKPPNEPGTNMTLDSVRQTMNVATVEYPGDMVFGMNTNHPDELPVTAWGHPGNSVGHHSFLVEWKLTKASGTVEPPPVEPPPSGTTSVTVDIGSFGTMTVISVNGVVKDYLIHLTPK